MLADTQKNEMVKSIIQAFDKWSVRYWQELLEGRQSSQGAKPPTDHSVEDAFLQRRALDISAFLHVMEQCSASKTITKHRKILISATIRSLTDGQFTISNLVHDDGIHEVEGRRPYTSRQGQRLMHEEYSETFFSTDTNKLHDGRLRARSTVFAENNVFPPPSRPVVDYLQAVYRASRSDAADTRLFYNSAIRHAFPAFLEDVLRFRDECAAVFASLGKRNDRIDFLRSQLTELTNLLVIFYSHLTSILAVHWFRSKSNERQRQFLESDFELEYGQDDARKAKEIMVSNFKDGASAFTLLSMSGTAFTHYGKNGEAASVFRQCIDIAKDDMQKGTLWQNMATAYRADHAFEPMLESISKALTHFRNTGDTYRVCNALQLKGESLWMLGDEKSARSAFDEVERHGQNLKPEERYKVPLILGISFGRLGERSLYKKYLTSALTMVPEDKTDVILNINQGIENPRPTTDVDTALSPDLRRKFDALCDTYFGYRF